MVIFTLPFYILSFGKHYVLEKDPDTYIVDITFEVKGWEAKL